jgi:hypothetical protein
VHFGDDRHYLALSDHGEGENRDLTGHSVGLVHFAYVTDNLDTGEWLGILDFECY